MTAPSTPPASTAGTGDGGLLAALKFDGDGLVPVIAQDRATGVVRMLAWANRAAIETTLRTGAATFWSRSRRGLWRKGETSGHTLSVSEVRIDCDGDAVLYLVDAAGPSCHTEHTSCFYRGTTIGANAVAEPAAVSPSASSPTSWPVVEDDAPPDPPAVVVARVAAVISSRRRDRPERSYVVSLLDAGWPKILGKIDEEAAELVESLPGVDAAHTAHEAADLLFHVLVGLEAAGVSVDSVFAQLRRRFGTSGLEEKSRRPAAAPGAVPP